MNHLTFSMDASLLAELGERLIGRAPIALGELAKNSYDADASVCRIELGDDEIIIADDGLGMSKNDFRRHWMRIGTTHKIDEQVSPRGRPLTGSKGIGRLSVQFLADRMTLESTSAGTVGRHLFATVDWSRAVRGRDLSTVSVAWEMRNGSPEYARDSATGTRITLRRLKTAFDSDDLETLGREVWMLRAPFKARPLPSRTRRPEDFEIEVNAPGIDHAQEAFDRVRRALFDNWKARITGQLDRGRAGHKATVAVEFRSGYPEGTDSAGRYAESVTIPTRAENDGETEPLIDKVEFEIRIFRTEGRQRGGIPVSDLRKYLTQFGNVSVYDTGFRLPYYGADHDWLNIALDQGKRLSTSELLPEHLRTQTKYMQDLPAPGRILGSVEINTNHERTRAARADAAPGEWLQIQPGRDRLHDNKAFVQLRDLVRFSLDFYANRHRLRALEALERQRTKEPPGEKYTRAVRLLDEHSDSIPKIAYREIRKELTEARRAVEVEADVLDKRAALLAPLATAGMSALALEHELSRETQLLARTTERLRVLARRHKVPELGELAAELHDARKRFDTLRGLFAPTIEMEAGERLKVRAVARNTVDAMRPLMPRVSCDLTQIPRDLRFPLGSLAEWNAVLQNILANAWNAMLESPTAKIAMAGGQTNRTQWLRVSDTGRGLTIPIDESNRLFEPFERILEVSPDKKSLMIGGHGLGLAIVRMIAVRRRAKAAFVEPEPGFSTTIEISWRSG